MIRHVTADFVGNSPRFCASPNGSSRRPASPQVAYAITHLVV